MTEKATNTSIEILGKFYSIKCMESELESLQRAAAYLNAQMKEVQESGKAINVERIALITALNLANQLLQGDKQKTGLMDKVNQKITMMQEKLDSAIGKTLQIELV